MKINTHRGCELISLGFIYLNTRSFPGNEQSMLHAQTRRKGNFRYRTFRTIMLGLPYFCEVWVLFVCLFFFTVFFLRTGSLYIVPAVLGWSWIGRDLHASNFYYSLHWTLEKPKQQLLAPSGSLVRKRGTKREALGSPSPHNVTELWGQPSPSSATVKFWAIPTTQRQGKSI